MEIYIGFDVSEFLQFSFPHNPDKEFHFPVTMVVQYSGFEQNVNFSFIGKTLQIMKKINWKFFFDVFFFLKIWFNAPNWKVSSFLI